MKRLMVLAVMLAVIGLAATSFSTASNFQTIILTRNLSWYNTSIMVCSTNTTVCSDVWIQNYTSLTNATSRVVTLEGFNSTYDKKYYFSAYLDGVLAYNNTQSYLGRGDIILDTMRIRNDTTLGVCYNGSAMFIGNLTGVNCL